MLSGAILILALHPSLVLAQVTPHSEGEQKETGTDNAAATTPETEVVITEKARSHFRAGVNLLQDPDGARYEEAYEQFKAAYTESPSWKILNNLAIAAMKLELDGEAIDAFEGYLAQGGDQVTELEHEQIERDLQTLRTSVVTLTIKAAPEGVKLIDERTTNRTGSIVNHYALQSGELVVRVRPGNHKITARLSGYEDSIWEFDAAVSSTHEHSFQLERAKLDTVGTDARPHDSANHRPIPLSVWVGLGFTGAFTAGAIGNGIVALGKNSTYEDANRVNDPDAEDLRKSVKTMNLVTDIFIGGAVVSGAVTTILYLTRPQVPVDSAFRIEPMLGPNLAALRLSGNF